MPEGLTVFLEGLLAYVGIAADYLVAHQSVLNLVLVFSTACLSILAIAAYMRPRETPEPVIRMPERRPFNGASAEALRPSEPKFDDGKTAEPEAPAMPAAVTPPAPVPPTDTGHRLSRLEESFLQLNRDLTELEDSTKDMKQDIEILGMRLRQPVPYDPIEPAPAPADAPPADIGTGMEMVEIVRPGELVPHPDIGTALVQLNDMQQRVEDLSAAVESQRRTVLAIGQVVAQMPDWRKLRPVLVESLEQIAAATEPSSRRTG